MEETGREDGLLRQCVTIINRRGLHARASAKFCQVAASYDADVKVIRDGISVGGCSIMGLLTLGAGTGTPIEITAQGPQAMEALDTLVKLVEHRFGEEE